MLQLHLELRCNKEAWGAAADAELRALIGPVEASEQFRVFVHGGGKMGKMGFLQATTRKFLSHSDFGATSPAFCKHTQSLTESKMAQVPP
jgi:hypothetical protein